MLASVLLGLVGCGTSDYRLAIGFDADDLRGRVDHLVVEIRTSCAPGAEVRASLFVDPSAMSDVTLPLGSGDQAIAVDAVDAGCQIFASGCTSFRAGSGDGARIDVQLASTAERTCEPGRCACSPDPVDGGRDAGPMDGGPSDAPPPDSPEDAFVADTPDTGPPCEADYAEVINAQGPVAYYRFDDAMGSSVVQDETADHFGSFRGTAPAPERGVAGAIPGDPSTAVYLGYGPDFQSAGIDLPDTLDPILEARPVTLSLWARMHEVHDGRDHYTLFFFEVFDTYGFRLGYRDDGRVVYFVNNSGGTGRLTTTDGHLSDRQWHHIVLRLLPGIAELYVDGVSRGVWDADDGVPGGVAAPTIGMGYVNGVHTDVDLDEFAIFDRSLAGTEIEAQYARGTLCAP